MRYENTVKMPAKHDAGRMPMLLFFIIFQLKRSNISLGTPHSGQTQSSGNFSNGILSFSAGSYIHPQTVHCHFSISYSFSTSSAFQHVSAGLATEIMSKVQQLTDAVYKNAYLHFTSSSASPCSFYASLAMPQISTSYTTINLSKMRQIFFALHPISILLPTSAN